MIRGTVKTKCKNIKVKNKKFTSEWPIVNNEFRLLIELSRGNNVIELDVSNYKRKFHLNYEPRSTRLRVTPVYVICARHDGFFQVLMVQILCFNFLLNWVLSFLGTSK